jgi:hypothetical protein
MNRGCDGSCVELGSMQWTSTSPIHFRTIGWYRGVVMEMDINWFTVVQKR